MATNFSLKSIIGGPSELPKQTIQGRMALADKVVLQSVTGLATIALLLCCTGLVAYLQMHRPGSEPFEVLLLIPITLGAAYLGLRAGFAAAIGALVLARFYLFPHSDGYLHFASQDDALRFASLTFTMSIVAGAVGLLNGALRELRDSESQRLAFSRGVLMTMTAGKLILCNGQDIKRECHANADLTMVLNDFQDVAKLRQRLCELARKHGFEARRLEDLATSVTEAATNAIKHGDDASAQAWINGSEVRVLISDRGAGISQANLARATLEPGFSTRATLGLGFTLMIAMADQVWLSTSTHGTQVLLRIASGGGEPILSFETQNSTGKLRTLRKG